MTRFCFREILLASFKEKKARRIAFDPQMTVIRGGNETGKSSLIKSLFRTFGAEPAKVHPRWKEADVRSLVRFEVDGIAYGLLRHGDHYALFDAAGMLLDRFQRVTRELAPAFARIVGFGLRLPDRDGQFVVLPPAYYFLPSYMDQDGSWTSQWSGFARLEQFSNWKKALVEYHAGIRDNHYYEAQAAKLDAEVEANKFVRRREGLQEVYASLRERFDAAQFDLDFESYRAELDELLTQCELLRRREEKFKKKVTELRNQRQALKTQLDITSHAREEALKDYAYASEQGDVVDCPTCGAGYDNSFTERFGLAMDEDNCASLMVRLTEEVAAIDEKIERELRESRVVTDEVLAIERLLARKEGELALGDLLRQEGRRELRVVMQSDIASLETKEGEALVRAKEAEKRMRQLDGKDRRQAVNDFFYSKMRSFLSALDVNSISDLACKKVDAVIADTGSELPRALLAYKLAFLHTAQKFGAYTPATLVIDSPNQQDQDAGHLERILTFLRDNRPEGVQLILGLVESADVSFTGSLVELNRKYSLLDAAEFEQVGEEIKHFVGLAIQ